MQRKHHLLICFLLCLYVLAHNWQMNLFPGERFPNKDHFWSDVRSFSMLHSLERGLKHGELPFVDLNTNLGWNLVGDIFSFLSLPNLLVAFLTPQWVVAVRLALLMMFAVLCTYFYVYKVSRGDTLLAFFAGAFYITAPYLLGIHYYHPLSFYVYFVPSLLLILHRVCEKGDKWAFILFALWAIVEAGSSDIHQLAIFPPIIVIYTFALSRWVHKKSILRSGTTCGFLLLLFFIASAHYLVPFFYNLQTNSEAVRALQRAGVLAPAVGTARNFLSFFRRYGEFTLWRPFEGSSMLLYLPSFFYIAVATFLLSPKKWGHTDKNTKWVVFLLMAISAAMVIENLVFYNPYIVKLLPKFKQTSGLMRTHTNLIAFAGAIAGFLSFSQLNRIQNPQLRTKVFAFIAIVTLAWDWLIFYHNPQRFRPGQTIHILPEPMFHNYVRIPMELPRMWFLGLNNPLHVRVWFHLAVVGFIYILGFKGKPTLTFSWRRVGSFSGIAVLLSLMHITVQKQLLAQASHLWLWSVRTPYRMDAYKNRRACIDKYVARYTPRYRTLYTGAPESGGRRLESWGTLGDTEMHNELGEKAYCSYREMDHPLAGILRGAFQGSKHLFNWYPPITPDVDRNLNLLKLFGIRYVFSEELTSGNQSLVYKGTCETDPPPYEILRIPVEQISGGKKRFDWISGPKPMHVYEVKDPHPLYFFANKIEKKKQEEALWELYRKEKAPWLQQTVWLEDEIKLSDKTLNGQNKILNIEETATSINATVNSTRDQFLVLSYLHRPFFRATLNGEPVPVHRAYGTFMAVKTPPGKHTIRIKYQGYDFYAGVFLSLLAFPLGIGSSRLLRKRKA